MSNEKEKQLPLFCQESEFVELLQKIQDETGEDIIGDLNLLNKLLQDQDKIDHEKRGLVTMTTHFRFLLITP